MKGEAKVLHKHDFSQWHFSYKKQALVRSNSFDLGLAKAQRDETGMLECADGYFRIQKDPHTQSETMVVQSASSDQVPDSPVQSPLNLHQIK